MVKSIPFEMQVDSDIEQWRMDTFWSKEPELIAWIDSMQPGEVLFDIGANIGIYTLYAASRGIKVVAVEPVLENYTRLVQNIELNKFDNVIPIYGACADGQMEAHWFDDITIPNCIVGASGAQLGHGEGKTRTIPVYEIEYLIYSLNLSPDYIKIDVDGQEEAVLCGAVLDDVKSILVEINTDKWAMDDAIEEMRESGFVPDDTFNKMQPHSSERREREGIKAVNVVFKNNEEAA
jgi:FkbM family methyltransferase